MSIRTDSRHFDSGMMSFRALYRRLHWRLAGGSPLGTGVGPDPSTYLLSSEICVGLAEIVF